MFREVERYQTADGKLHETPEKAERHVHDRVCELLERATAPLVHAGRMSRSEQFRVIETLAPDAQTARQLACAILALYTDA